MKRVLIPSHLLDDPPALAELLRHELKEGQPILLDTVKNSLGAFLADIAEEPRDD